MQTNPNPYETLARRGRDWARLIANLRLIEAAIAKFPLESFFEPVSLLVSENGGPLKLDTISARHLDAWAKHVAYGTIVRLGSLTRICLGLLEENQLIAAGLIERAILENAGRASHSLDTLTSGYKNRSWDKMNDLILKILFGTRMTNPRGTIFEELAEATARWPVKPSSFIDSLDSFASAPDTRFFRDLYGFLCDLTHASQRGNSAFCEVVSDTGSGWVLQYKKDETGDDGALLGALRATVRCLQAGYGASALLLRWSFDDEMPQLVARAPGEGDIWIWHEILDPDLAFWR